MPLTENGEVKAVGLEFSRQLVLGGEIGVSYRLGMFTPRLWYGRDFTATFFKGNRDTAGGQTYRTTLETRMDGPTLPGLGEHSNFYVVAYVMEESTRITNGSRIIGSSDVKDNVSQNGFDEADKTKEIAYQIRYAGLGIGLSW